MKNKKLFLILILLLPITLLVGFSTWVIVNDVLLSPQENKSSTFYIELNDQEVEFNGSAQLPSSDKLNLSDSNIKYKYRDVNDPAIDSSYIEGAPTDAGEYYIYFKSLDNSIEASDVKFTIKKKVIKLLNNEISINYGDCAPYWADMHNKIFEQINIVDSNNNVASELSSEDYTITGMHNGVYYYGEDGYSVSGLKTTNDIAGSTYVANVVLKSSLFKNYEYNDNRLIIKYKTAKTTIDGNSNTLCTIEEAIEKGSGDITIVGGDQFSNADDQIETYVETVFTALSNTQGNPYKTSEFTLSSRTLNIQYKEGSSSTGWESTTATSGNVYTVLTIPEGITLNLDKSSLIVGADIAYVSHKSTVTCNRGVIMNDGKIVANSTSTIYCYGFIKSSSLDKGEIILGQDSTMQESLIAYDFAGGTTTSSIYQKVMPFNAWSFHNNSCKTKIFSGATYRGFVFVQLKVSLSDQEFEANFDIVKPNSTTTSKCLFIAKNSPNTTDYIIKSVKYGTYENNTSDNQALHTITGSNQINGVKDNLEVYGDYTDSTFSIEVNNMLLETSKTKPLPFGFMDVTLCKGTLELKNSDYMFLPGTSLTIEEGAVLTTDTDVDISFETYKHIEEVKVDYPSKGDVKMWFGTWCRDTKDSYMVINGEVNSNGNLGGKILSYSPGAKLNIYGKNTSSHASMFSAIGYSDSLGSTKYNVAYQVTNFEVTGYVNSSTQIEQLNAQCNYVSQNTSIKIGNDNIYTWSSTAHENIKSGNSSGTLVKNYETMGGTTCLVSGSLITMSDGSKKKVEDLVAGDKVIVFNHYTGKYDVSVILYNTHDDLEWNYYDVINLIFDDGTKLRIHNEHYLYDIDLRKYVLINEQNRNEFIGHRFYAASFDGINYKERIVTLSNSYITNEYVGIYGPTPAYHLNVLSDDILTIPGDSDPFINIFEMNENYKYDEELMKKDIEEYGLMDYSELAEYIPFEIFEYYHGEYLNVAIGKGYTTKERIIELINKYLLDYSFS